MTLYPLFGGVHYDDQDTACSDSMLPRLSLAIAIMMPPSAASANSLQKVITTLMVYLMFQVRMQIEVTRVKFLRENANSQTVKVPSPTLWVTNDAWITIRRRLM